MNYDNVHSVVGQRIVRQFKWLLHDDVDDDDNDDNAMNVKLLFCYIIHDIMHICSCVLIDVVMSFIIRVIYH